MDTREIIIEVNGGYVEFYFKNANTPFRDTNIEKFIHNKDMEISMLKAKQWYRDDVAEQLKELLSKRGIII